MSYPLLKRGGYTENTGDLGCERGHALRARAGRLGAAAWGAAGRGSDSCGGGSAAAPVGMFTAIGTCLSRAKLASSQFKLRFKLNWGLGGGEKKVLRCGRSKRIKTCRRPRSSQQKRKTWGFAQVLVFRVGAGATAAMTRQACGALLHARLCGTDRRDRPDKPQTLCLPSLCILLLLCCCDGFKNNWECPLGLRLWDKSDPAAREKFTKYSWLKIIP